MRLSILTIISFATLSLAAHHERNRMIEHRQLPGLFPTKSNDSPPPPVSTADSSSTSSPASVQAPPPSTSSSQLVPPTTSSDPKHTPSSSSSSSSSSVVPPSSSTSKSAVVPPSSSSSSSTPVTSSSSTLSSSSSVPTSTSTLSSASSSSKASTLVVTSKESTAAPQTQPTTLSSPISSDTLPTNATAAASAPTGASNVDTANSSNSFLHNTGVAVPVLIIVALIGLGALYAAYRYVRRRQRIRDELEAAAYFDHMGREDEFGAAEEKGNHPDYFTEDGEHMTEVQPAPLGAYVSNEMHFGPGITAEGFYGAPAPPPGVYNPTGALALDSFHNGPMQSHQQYGGYQGEYPLDYPPRDGFAPGPPPVSTVGGPAVHAQPYHMNAPTITITPDYHHEFSHEF